MKINLCLASILFLPFITYSAVDSCSTQINDLNKKISIAKERNNSYEVLGLQISLDKVKKYCTDSRQLDRAKDKVNKKELKVKEAELDIQKSNQELEEAMRDGRRDKITKKKIRLEEKKLKLEHAKDELRDAISDQESLKK